MATTAALLLALCSQVRIEPDALSFRYAGQRIVLEDVCTSILGTGDEQHFRMKNCSGVKFYPGDALINRIQGANLEVTGRVQQQDGDLVVFVESIKRLPDDATRYADRVAQIDANDYVSWYELAEWARGRGEKYGSQQMREKSQEAYRTAHETERRLAAGSPERLEALRRRAVADKAMSDRDLGGLDHEILRAEFRRLPPGDAAALRRFATKVQQKLGGDPVQPPLAAIQRDQYDADPIEIYNNAGDQERLRIARYWQACILNDALQIEGRASEVGANALAALAAKELPDYPDLVKDWQKKAASDLRHNPLLFTADQAWEIAQRVGKPGDAELLLAWLKAKEDQLVAEEIAAERRARDQGLRNVRDAKSRFDLAEKYREWLPNHDAAKFARRRLLEETLRIDPQFAEAEVQLRSLGVARSSDAASRSAAVGSAFRIGMRADEITASPDFKARVVTKGRTVHQWIYLGIGGGKTIYILLEPGPGGVLTVSDVRN